MGKLILECQLSLDGYMASEDGSTDWMNWSWGPDWTWSPELQEYHTNIITSADTTLLSGKTPEMFIDHWHDIAQDTSNSLYTFAKHIDHTDKITFSHSDRHSSHPDATAMNGDLKTEIYRFKSSLNHNVIAYGGATFASSLLAAGVVDDLYLIINPVALGRGMSLFDKLEAPLSLKLVEARQFGDGMAALAYKI